MTHHQRRSVMNMTAEFDRIKFADEAAKHLCALLKAIEAGELLATATVRARIEGAVVALEAIASPDPVAALDAMRASFRG